MLPRIGLNTLRLVLIFLVTADLVKLASSHRPRLKRLVDVDCESIVSLEEINGESQILSIDCGNASNYDQVTGCPVNTSVTRVQILNCPLNRQVGVVLRALGLALENLTHLTLSRNSGDGELNQRHFDGLESLRVLNITHNSLTSLPEYIFSGLDSLRILNVSYNQLSTLPEYIFGTTLGLEVLDLSNNNLEYLPVSLFDQLQSLVHVELQNNSIKELRSLLFSDTELLTYLDLSNNDISSLQASLFSSLASLNHLNISANKLETLPSSIFFETKKLQTLDLSSNSLSSLQIGNFNNLLKLEILNLGKNLLNNLPDGIFLQCESLLELYLDHNKIDKLRTTFFPYASSLVHIDLGHNNITYRYPLSWKIGFSSFELDRQTNLKRVILNNNNFEDIPGSFNRMYIGLEYLDLSNNKIAYIKFPSLFFLNSRVTLDLRNNSILTFNFVNMYPVMYKSEVDVLLEGNNLVCDCRLYRFARMAQGLQLRNIDTSFLITVQDIDQVSCHQPNISESSVNLLSLDISSLTCSIKTDHNCTNFYRPHDNTIYVNCSYLNLRHIPVLIDTISFMGGDFHLTLDLTNNSITSLSGINDSSLVRLRTLILANNKLSIFNLTGVGLPLDLRNLDVSGNNLTDLSLPVLEYLNRTNMELTLGHNPWECDCQLRQLLGFLHVPLRKVVDFDALRCGGTGEQLMELSEYDLCPFFQQPMVLVTIFATLFCLVIFACLGTVSFYRYQQGIKVWLFTHRLCLWAIKEDELDADKKYDAFISYSHKDEKFVNEVLVPGLETGDYKYRICLHYRDWMPGEFIQNQIMRSVENSRRTLVVLSSNFIESVWGQLEFRAAHSQALQDGTNRIIVVILGEIPPEKELDEKLRLYVSMKTYVRWGDNKFWEKLRYLMPHPPDLLNPKKCAVPRKRKDTDKLELCKSDSKTIAC